MPCRLKFIVGQIFLHSPQSVFVVDLVQDIFTRLKTVLIEMVLGWLFLCLRSQDASGAQNVWEFFCSLFSVVIGSIANLQQKTIEQTKRHSVIIRHNIHTRLRSLYIVDHTHTTS